MPIGQAFAFDDAVGIAVVVGAAEGIGVGALVIGQPEPLEPPSVLEEPVGYNFQIGVAETEMLINLVMQVSYK